MLTPQELFPETYTKLTRFVEEREKQRRKYKPAAVRVLFIGESMPAGEDFFYYANGHLYKYTQEAFERVFGPTCGTGEHFLRFFAEQGCYLDALCPVPVNNLDDSERYRTQRESIPLLAERLRQYDPHPKQVVIVMKSLAIEAREALIEAGAGEIKWVALPFPGQWPRNRAEDKDGLVAVLQNTPLVDSC
jgi:hypothetical protein